MRIYLGNTEFPAAPEKLEAEREGGWASADRETWGENLHPRPSRLRAVRFSGIFPGSRMGFVTAGTLLSPGEYSARMEAALSSKEPLRLVVSGGAAPFSMLAVVEKFLCWEQAGEDGDLYFTLALREYRPYGTQSVAVKVVSPDGKPVGSAGSSSGRTGSPAVPKTYTVQKGDNLWSIAKRFLGDGSRYGEIAKWNNIGNPSLIYPGQVLRLE